jgi:hypothetical protein
MSEHWTLDRLNVGEMGYKRYTLKFKRDFQPSSDPIQTDDNPRFCHIIYKKSCCTLFHLKINDTETEASEGCTV